MSNSVKKNPVMNYFYSKSKSLTFEKLSGSKSVKEYITPTFEIYSDSSMQTKIGYMSQSYIINQEITIFTTNVVFTNFIASLTYSHTQLTSVNKNMSFIDTVLYGNGDLFGAQGYVETELNPNTNVVKSSIFI
jgi:hypothetical protein